MDDHPRIPIPAFYFLNDMIAFSVGIFLFCVFSTAVLSADCLFVCCEICLLFMY